MKGRETFSVASDAYAISRPQYPADLFEWIASQCDSHQSAWDCATGNGQAALGLAPHFKRIEATDGSAAQLEYAFPVPNVSYSVQAAEETAFPVASFDLITVAQALHWFKFERFWPEVCRTGKPNAFFCAWGYAWFECGTELQASLFTPMLRVLEPHWAIENGILWRGYRSEEIAFPFNRIDAPPFAIELHWNIDQILCHVRTWSAYKRAVATPTARRLLRAIERDAIALFGSSGALQLKAPLSIAAGRVP